MSERLASGSYIQAPVIRRGGRIWCNNHALSLSLSLSLCTCMQGDFPNGFYHSTNAAVKHLVQLWRMKMRQTIRKYVFSGLSEWLWNVCRFLEEYSGILYSPFSALHFSYYNSKQLMHTVLLKPQCYNALAPFIAEHTYTKQLLQLRCM